MRSVKCRTHLGVGEVGAGHADGVDDHQPALVALPRLSAIEQSDRGLIGFRLEGTFRWE